MRKNKNLDLGIEIRIIEILVEIRDLIEITKGVIIEINIVEIEDE